MPLDKSVIGQTVKDKVTGFKGRATGYVSYLTGCDQVLVTPKGDGDKYPESVWIDVNRLTVVGTKKLKLDTETYQGAMDTPPTK